MRVYEIRDRTVLSVLLHVVLGGKSDMPFKRVICHVERFYFLSEEFWVSAKKSFCGGFYEV